MVIPWFPDGIKMDFLGYRKLDYIQPGSIEHCGFSKYLGIDSIGLGLILGLFTRWAAIAGTVLLALYYLFLPPFIGMETAAPQEGNYLIVNKNLIEAVMLLLIAVSPAAKKLDWMFFEKGNDL